MRSNKDVLAKADMTVTDLINDGGYLLDEKAKKFLRKMIEQANFMPAVFMRGLKSHTAKLEKIGFGSRVMHAATSGQALPESQRSKATTETVTITTHEAKAEIRLPYDVLEDNIEGKQMENTIMAALRERVGVDLDELFIQGITTSADPYLAMFNGGLAAATSHAVNAAGAALETTLLSSIKKSMPNKYRRDKAKMVYMTSHNAQHDYIDQLSNRGTALGDAFLTGTREPGFHGIPVRAFDMMPEDQGIGTNQTSCLLMNPKNFIGGIWRNIMLETDKDISAGVVIIVATFRVGANYQEEDAVVNTSAIAT